MSKNNNVLLQKT